MASTHAVVIGGSMAGLCAARVLSDYYDRVTVVDRDAYPEGALERAGVPQSRHVHALLARGRQELNRFFPGFDQLMLERGAHEIDFGWDFAVLRPSGWEPRQGGGIITLFASRNLIESTVRELCRKLPNVELRERTAVTGLAATSQSPLQINGVHICPQDGGVSTTLAADLVVDASGRASKAPEWLHALGVEPPEETVVDSHAGYSSRWFKAPAPDRVPADWWWKGIWIDLKVPDHMFAGVLFPVEQGRWIVTLAGVGKHYPPSDEAEFMDTLPNLHSPILAEAVRLAEPISPVYCNRAMANRFRHYEHWKSRLDGFIAVGDSVCAFNPVYGQGMTTGTLSAGVLEQCLKQYGPVNAKLPQYVFRAQARVQADPWQLATGADFRFPGTDGTRPVGSRVFDGYVDTLLTVAMEDVVVRRRFGEVLQMLKPPASLFDPRIVSRVVAGALRRWLRKKRDVETAIPAKPPAAVPAS